MTWKTFKKLMSNVPSTWLEDRSTFQLSNSYIALFWKSRLKTYVWLIKRLFWNLSRHRETTIFEFMQCRRQHLYIAFLLSKPKVINLELLAGRHLFGLGKPYQGSSNSHFELTIEIKGIQQDQAKFKFKVCSKTISYEI